MPYSCSLVLVGSRGACSEMSRDSGSCVRGASVEIEREAGEECGGVDAGDEYDCRRSTKEVDMSVNGK